MRTIGGGTVRYVDIRLLPCPEDEARIGQCEANGRIEMLWKGRVVESFDVRAGDELGVANGAVFAPDTELLAADSYSWRRYLRAAIPAGVEATVRWSESVVETTDEVTDLSRTHFARGNEPVTVTLYARDGALLATHALRRDAMPIVADGALVRRGERLAAIPEYTRRCEIMAGLDTVRALLCAWRLDRAPFGLVAPCDATVIDLGQRWIVLRSDPGRVLRLRRPAGQHVMIAVGDTVRAGDLLTGGERSHRALLHAWGPDRLSEHLLDELELIFGRRVPRAYWALTLRAMLHGGQLHGVAELAREARRR